MLRFSRVNASRLFTAALCAGLAIPSLAQVSVRSVKVLGSKDSVEIEVEASDRIVPETRVLTGPDRLVVDFPNSVPSSQVRSQSVERGDVKDVRVGLFQSKPPITRVVLDLKSARSYQIFPYGRTVMIKIIGDATASNAYSASSDYAPQQERRAGLVVANYTTGVEPVRLAAPALPALQVTYRDGLLGIHSNKATLSEVLYAVQQRTGADISIAAGAEQEKVVAEIEPAPAPEVLARLLNGSRFNFLILSAPDNPGQLDRVILTARTEGNFAPATVQPNNDPPIEEQPPVRIQPAALAVVPGPPTPAPELENSPDEETNDK